MSDTHINNGGQWFDTAGIQQVMDLLTGAGAESVWVKRLVPNNNSKQQIFLGNDPSDLSFLPLGVPSYTPTKSRKKKAGAPVIQIPVPWRWVTPDGGYDAPNAKMCYYPQYPEVRFSGFLQGCREAPSELLNESKRGHELNRCLFFGPAPGADGRPDHVVGLVVGAPSPASRYVLDMDTFEEGRICPVRCKTKRTVGEISVLEKALAGIIGKKITPWRMMGDGRKVRPYIAPNAPGLTLEAELGVGENAIPGPDFDVWELKAIKQPSLERLSNHKVTLFTPQPDLGWITEHPQRRRRKRRAERVLLHLGRHQPPRRGQGQGGAEPQARGVHRRQALRPEWDDCPLRQRVRRARRRMVLPQAPRALAAQAQPCRVRAISQGGLG